MAKKQQLDIPAGDPLSHVGNVSGSPMYNDSDQ